MKLPNYIYLFLLSIMFILSCKKKHKKFQSIEIEAKKSFENNLIFPDTTYTIELTYYPMGCPCPEWATNKNIDLYEEKIGEIPMDSLFVTIQPEENYGQHPFDLKSWEEDRTSHLPRFLFEGRLSQNKYKWQGEDGTIWENRVFQYSNCKFIKK